MKDTIAPMTFAWHARQQRHRHNGLIGNMGCIRAYMKPVTQSPTLSNEAKILAHQIGSLVDELTLELRRARMDINEDGTRTLRLLGGHKTLAERERERERLKASAT